MSYTKRQVVEAAMAEIGLAAYAFDLMPEQLELALRRLDSMMAEWNAKGLRLAYPIASRPQDINAEDDTNLPDVSWEAVITNLACRLAPSYGKALNVETKVTARHSLNTLFGKYAMPNEMQLGIMPVGAGHKALDDPFSSAVAEDLIVGQDNTLDFN